MRASQRYELTSPWLLTEQAVVEREHFADTTPVLVVREVADIRDTVTGDTYHHGAFRVRSFLGKKSYKRAKTFYGESAWNDSSRLYADILYEAEMAR
jgi:hypothetical protein